MTQTVRFPSAPVPLPAQGFPARTVQEGERVFVRVLQDRGGGSYEVSGAGARFLVRSERALAAGDRFFATVSLGNDGTVRLEPQPTGLPAAPESLQPSLAALLAAEGIPADGATVRLLQFLQQSGLRLDKPLMLRAHAAGRRFAGQEDDATEAAALLLEKGMEPTDAAISRLLALRSFGGGTGGQGDGAPRHDGDGTSGTAGNADDFVSALYASPLPEKEGLLTLCNHLSAGAKHWVLLPYEWDCGGRAAGGIIRLLLDVPSGTTERLHATCRTGAADYYVSLRYGAGEPVELLFCTEPPAPDAATERRYEQLLRASLRTAGLAKVPEIRYAESAREAGLCSVAEPLSLVAGCL